PRPPPGSTLFPYTTLFRSWEIAVAAFERAGGRHGVAECYHNLAITYRLQGMPDRALAEADRAVGEADAAGDETLRALALPRRARDRKSTRLNSSHSQISYA